MEPKVAPVAEVRFGDLLGHLGALLEVFVVVNEVVSSGFERAVVEAGVLAWSGRVGHANRARERYGGMILIIVQLLSYAEAWLGGLTRSW